MSVSLENLLNDVEVQLEQKGSVDKDDLQKLVVLFVEQVAEKVLIADVVNSMLETVTSTQSASQLAGKVKVFAREVRRFIKRMKRFGDDSESDDDDDDDDGDGEIKCLQWNVAEYGARYGSVLGLVWYIFTTGSLPDVMFLNETKATIVTFKFISTLLGYDYEYYQSSRGSAIIWRRNSKKFTVGQIHSYGQMDWNGKGPEIEVAWAEFKLRHGDTYRLASCYILEGTDGHLTYAANALGDLKKAGRCVAAGDLNMPKDKFDAKWSKEGFHDCLREDWNTKVEGTNETAVDYVMTNEVKHVLAHKPARVISSGVHLLVPFSIGHSLQDFEWCKKSSCVFGCTR